MRLRGRRVDLVLQTLEDVERMVEGLSDADRAEVSPEWLARLRAAEAGDPWAHAFRVIERASGAEVGMCSFKGPPVDGIVEIAYGIDPAHRLNGYATEAAAALTRFALSEPAVRLVRAHTLPDSAVSKRVLEKCRFAYVGDVIDPEDGQISRFERADSGRANGTSV